MPYIDRDERPEARACPRTVGELTYAVTDQCVKYLPENPAYSDYAQVVAALECAKLEFYWRSVRPYEDKKCRENGDVY